MLNRRYDSERLSSSIRHDCVHTSHTVIVHWKPRHIMNAFPTHSSLALIISRYIIMLHTAFARFLPNQQSIPGSHLEYLPILLCPSYNCWYRTLVSSCILVTSMNWWYDSIVVIHRSIEIIRTWHIVQLSPIHMRWAGSFDTSTANSLHKRLKTQIHQSSWTINLKSHVRPIQRRQEGFVGDVSIFIISGGQPPFRTTASSSLFHWRHLFP